MFSKKSFPGADSFPLPYALFLAVEFPSVFLEEASQPVEASPLPPCAARGGSSSDVGGM